MQGTEKEIDKTRERLYELEAKLQNGEQLRREIEIKQRKYCGLNQIFRSGTLEEQKMLLAIVVQRIESAAGLRTEYSTVAGFRTVPGWAD